MVNSKLVVEKKECSQTGGKTEKEEEGSGSFSVNALHILHFLLNEVLRLYDKPILYLCSLLRSHHRDNKKSFNGYSKIINAVKRQRLNGYSKIINAVKRQRNLGLNKPLWSHLLLKYLQGHLNYAISLDLFSFIAFLQIIK